MGGIGKTQTAVEYVYRYRDKYQAVLWVNADSTLALKAGFADLARLMHLPHPKDDLDQAVLAIKRWLEILSGWLLVLDNADDPAMLDPFLPYARHGHVLITSRAGDFQDLGIVEPVKLEEWSVGEAAGFLLRRCGREDDEVEERDAAERLARDLGGLPLALEQAAAYIKESGGMKFRRYLESYRRRGLDLLKQRGPALGQYPESVVTTWAANFEAVRENSPAAADVLQFSAFLSPDDIPFELVGQGAGELGGSVATFLARVEGDATVVYELLRELARFSLIRIDAERESYNLHRLVQEVLRAAMDEPTRREWTERTVRAIDRAFPPTGHHNWPLCSKLLPHALAVTSLVGGQAIPCEGEVSLLVRTAYFLHEKGRVEEAEPLYVRALERCEGSPGEQDQRLGSRLNDLGVLYLSQGKYDRAEPLLQRALELRVRLLGGEDADTVSSLDNLAWLYHRRGRYAEAESLYSRILAFRENRLAIEPFLYARTLRVCPVRGSNGVGGG